MQCEILQYKKKQELVFESTFKMAAPYKKTTIKTLPKIGEKITRDTLYWKHLEVHKCAVKCMECFRPKIVIVLS